MSQTFDVLVVGGGSAGCVVAARLAADPNRSVLLLEAGPDRSSAISPALRDGWNLPRGADWPDDWGFASEPDTSSSTQPLRRGKVLGGTSWLTRFAVRGSPLEFDGWASTGLRGWSFEEVLPAFRRLEADADFVSEPWHGDAGPVPIDRYLDLEPSPIHAAAVAAMTAFGIPAVDDLNRPGAVGVGRMPMSSSRGRRVSAADAYLPADGRGPSNLTIRADTQIASVLLGGSRATGVRLLDGGVATADLIVLCTGTYGSPPILLRSGIGPAADLRALGIPVVVDLPGVGANLSDHPAVELDLQFAGAGSSDPVLHSLATWRSSLAGPEAAPDLAYWVSDPVGTPAAALIDSVLMQPRSRGSVRLRSTDPADAPRIELPGVRERADVDRLGEAYLRAIEIAATPGIRRLCSGALPAAPAAGDLRRFVTENAYSIPHVVGTCAMGIDRDAGAVVDASGRVHGVDGLAVVDASILPGPTSGFPNLVTMMVAEHLADRLAALSARV